jgi:hypothetical protein
MAFTYPPSGGSGAVDLDGLMDVTITEPISNGSILVYNGTEWVNQEHTDEADKIFVPNSPLPSFGLYGPKGDKSYLQNWWDPNNCLGFEIMFDKTMWIESIAVMVRNFPDPAWAGGGVRVWLFNSDPVTGLPSTLNQELGLIEIPTTNPAPMPFMNAIITSGIIDGGVLLNANTKYYIVSSNGIVGEGYGNGPGPDLYYVSQHYNATSNNIPYFDSNMLQFGSGDNGAFFFGTLNNAGGINLSEPPANAGQLSFELVPSQKAPLILLQGGID